MYRIDNTSAVPTLPVPGLPGTPGFFTDGNPAAALEATIVDAWWANIVQEEILTVVTRAGLAPRKDDNTQLWQALNALFAAGGNFLPLSGGIMTGFITLHAPPAQPMHAANRQYVDDAVNAAMSGTGYVPEAPPGPLTYGRLNAAWNPVLPLTGGTIRNTTTSAQAIDGSLLRIEHATDPAIVLKPTGPLNVTNDHWYIVGWNNWLGFYARTGGGFGFAWNGDTNFNRNVSVNGTVETSQFNLPNRFNVNDTRLWGANSIDCYWAGGGNLIGTWVAQGRFRIGNALDIGIGYGYIDATNGNAQFSGFVNILGRATVGDLQSNANIYVPNGEINLQHSFEPWLRLTGPNRQWHVITRNDGYFLIGTVNPPTGRFSIDPTNGHTFINGTVLESLGAIWARSGDCRKPGGGPWNDTSDERVKKNVESYSRGLDAIQQLRPVTFQFNGLADTADDGQTYHGLMAQEAREVMPELVYQEPIKLRAEDEDDTDVFMMNSTALTYALVNAVQELAARLETLERRS